MEIDDLETLLRKVKKTRYSLLFFTFLGKILYIQEQEREDLPRDSNNHEE